MSFEDFFSIFSSGSHLVQWCRIIAAILDFRLTQFQLVSIQKSSFYYRASFGSKRPKVWKEMSRTDFQNGGSGGYLGFSLRSVLPILCLLGALMLIIKFQLLDYTGDVQNMNSQPFSHINV